MPDTATIIKALTDMHKAIDKSFNGVYERIETSNKRVTKIEKDLAVKKALCQERKESEIAKKDFWRPVIRTISVAGILALCTIAWSKLNVMWDKIKTVLDWIP
ncbi:MAG: hypothetical protein U9Q18_01535 [Caldisericota bacterium]|nr:hypothetical protein [Caldisericota bacterium]